MHRAHTEEQACTAPHPIDWLVNPIGGPLHLPWAGIIQEALAALTDQAPLLTINNTGS
jgi:hypothetical protein